MNPPPTDQNPKSAPAGRPAPQRAVPPDGTEEFLRLCQAVWQRRVFVVLVAGACLILTAIYCFRTTPLYRATATIEIAPQEQTIIRIEDVSKLGLNQLDVLNTLVLKSTRATVLQRVVALNKLTDHPAFAVNPGQKPTEAQVVAQAVGCVKSQLRRNTRLCDITAIHPDPEVAQTLANGVATQFIRQEQEDQVTATRSANASLLEEAGRLKGELERSERLLQTYREQNKTVSLEDRQNIVDQKLHSLAQQLNETRAELTQILAQQKQALAVTNAPERLLTFPAIKNDAVVAGLQTQLAQQETLVKLYATRYQEKYPKMIAVRQQLEEMRRSLATAAVAALQTLNSVVEAARSKEHGLEQAVAEAEQNSLALSRLAIEYNILQRDMESNRNLYQAILQRLKETEVSKGIEKNSLQIIEPAGLPPKPFKPNRPLLLAGGLLGGLVLGLGLAFLLAQLDHTIKSVDDAERQLGTPLFGVLPFDTQLEKSDRKLALAEHPNSLLAEAFRSLRANVAMTARLPARQVVLVTSAISGEGKTMTACNYALALAQQGMRTVIVDLDLRRPRVGKAFNLKSESPGISDFLLGQARLEELKQPTALEKLTVIPAGSIVPNPAEQLAGPWLVALLKELRSQYDVVVLDSAPVTTISDTLEFVALADVVLLLVCKRYTPVKAARQAVAILQRSGVRMVGLVLNRVSAKRSGYYYDYTYCRPDVKKPQARQLKTL